MTNPVNTVLYTGITNDLVRRVYEHKNKLAPGFTEKYNINKLVYFEVFQDPMNAIQKEKSIKNLLRSKKFDLIKSKNPKLIDLYPSIL